MIFRKAASFGPTESTWNDGDQDRSTRGTGRVSRETRVWPFRSSQRLFPDARLFLISSSGERLVSSSRRYAFLPTSISRAFAVVQRILLAKFNCGFSRWRELREVEGWTRKKNLIRFLFPESNLEGGRRCCCCSVELLSISLDV